jgi:hypothetical protein
LLGDDRDGRIGALAEEIWESSAKGNDLVPPLRAPLLDSLLLEDQFVQALLISYSRNLGMDSADDAKTNSGELHRLGGEGREGDRDAGTMLGFVGGGSLLIDLGGGGVHLVHRGRRRWIGRQSSLHRAASQLEVEGDDPPRAVTGRLDWLLGRAGVGL